MKKEFSSQWYDEKYKLGGHGKEYFKEPENSIYFNSWSQLIKFIDKKNDKIFELGCGVGQLAKILVLRDYNYLYGIDFSKEAIEFVHKSLGEHHADKFWVDDVYGKDLYELDYNTIICCEVLEHLDNDLEVIRNIRKGTKFLFTVPNFDSKSHVRFFTHQKEIRERYEKYLDIKTIEIVFLNDKNKLYIVNSTRK